MLEFYILEADRFFDWDVLHGNEILREQIGGLVDKLLT